MALEVEELAGVLLAVRAISFAAGTDPIEPEAGIWRQTGERGTHGGMGLA